MKKINKLLTTLFISFIFIFSYCGLSFGNEPEKSKPKLERHFIFEAIPMNLEEIIKYSGKIFAGICTGVEEIENDPESHLPVIKYTFKITEGIKGVDDQNEITFKQWQPTARSVGYEIGKKYVLFLYPESSRGLTSTIGTDGQGYFEILEEGFILKREIVRNRLGNKGLSRNLKTQKRISIENNKFVNDYVHRCSELGLSMRYREFIEAVRYLVNKK
ncbi:MAG: hypothetical protein HY094_00085 [Candidatus Melainabacteria bacterium]|nr:hypothetical protein [Candidatus Melainabacteria bacterium]